MEHTSKIVAIEVPGEAWPGIFEAGGVTLTESEKLDLWYWMLNFTHGYTTALIDGKLTNEELELLGRIRRLASSLEESLDQLDFGLASRLHKADEDEKGRRQASENSILSELTHRDRRLQLIGSENLIEGLKLLIAATDIVLTIPVRKTGERNRATVHFMTTIKAIFDAAEAREPSRQTKWPMFFRALFNAMPKPTQKLLVSAEAALKHLSRHKSADESAAL